MSETLKDIYHALLNGDSKALDYLVGRGVLSEGDALDIKISTKKRHNRIVRKAAALGRAAAAKREESLINCLNGEEK